MERREFMILLHEYRSIKANKSQRKGQAVFNLAFYHFPDVVDSLRGSQIDPFYNDNNINAFLDYLGIN